MCNSRYLKLGLILGLLFIYGYSVEGQRKHLNINKVYVGELGLGIGAANYYGDLNTHAGMEAVKMSVGAFYRYFLGQYFGASLHVNYANLGYSDVYNSNDFQHRRNLSFNSSIFSISLQGDFNFFRFIPGSMKHRFTPYLSVGGGFFHYNPYAYYKGDKYYLQPLGTEGQGRADSLGTKYDLWSWEIPVEVGVKYNLNKRWNLFLSISYRFTGTDYLDDVSKRYAGAASFDSDVEPIAVKLQDRSGVYGDPIGIKGRSRGNSENKDQYVLLQVGISYLFTRYRCP